ncbi:hypothetical protein M1247_29575 [Mycobacterium sp. 21AC1]|uniref:hypothetical protein n=1 Tax=[Mycobacterium] appelbergii TaxID=2939269 RepID=UPI0029394083|nr:hypothetical protein [Mycobacterium sp. 21AC1]MDV3129088.1 hypothetical protein [Mycobacterium sp. 21AC1]
MALIVAAGFVIFGLYFGDEVRADPLPACQYEDGNPDGQPCMWTSPRTGKTYYNDGSEYRN